MTISKVVGKAGEYTVIVSDELGDCDYVVITPKKLTNYPKFSPDVAIGEDTQILASNVIFDTIGVGNANKMVEMIEAELL